MTKSKQYAIALYQLTKDKKEQEIQDVIERFIKTVQKNGDELLLKQILNHFQQIAQKNGDFNYLKIITARGNVGNDLFSGLDWAKVKHEVKPDILGGAIAIINHQYLIDNSIKRKIRKIYESN